MTMCKAGLTDLIHTRFVLVNRPPCRRLEQFDERCARYHGNYAQHFHAVNGFYRRAEEAEVVDDEAAGGAGDEENDYGHSGAEEGG